VRATAAAQSEVIADPDLGFAAAEAEVETIAEDPEVARAVLDATIDLWRGEEFAAGRIPEELWATAYDTMQRLGFIDGSVPLEAMIDATVAD
jgi:hypothetical protein